MAWSSHDYDKVPGTYVFNGRRSVMGYPLNRMCMSFNSAENREEFRREMGQLRLGFDTQEMETLLGTAGLDDVRVRALAPDPEAKGPALLLATATRSGPGPRKVR